MTGWLLLNDRLRGHVSLESIASRLRADAQRRRSLIQRMEVIAEASAQPDPRSIISAAARALYNVACESGRGAVVIITAQAEDGLMSSSTGSSGIGIGVGGAHPPRKTSGAFSAGGGGGAPIGGVAEAAGAAVDQAEEETFSSAPLIHIETANAKARRALEKIFERTAAKCLSRQSPPHTAAGGRGGSLDRAAEDAGVSTAELMERARVSSETVTSGAGSTAEDLAASPEVARSTTANRCGARAPLDQEVADSAAIGQLSLRLSKSDNRVSLAHLSGLSGHLNAVTAEDISLGVNAFSDWKAGARRLSRC